MTGDYRDQDFTIDDEFNVICDEPTIKDLLESFVSFYLGEYSSANGDPLFYVRARLLDDFQSIELDEPEVEAESGRVY